MPTNKQHTTGNGLTLQESSLKKTTKFDRIAQIAWLLTCLSLAIFFFFNPQLLNPETIKHKIASYGGLAVFLYFGVSMFRGFFLLPSTPFVFAGTAMYPDKPLMIISISMAGILFSATLLYFFSDRLGFAGYLEHKHPRPINATKELLSGNKATLFVALWSFFPLVPTDVICYVAGVIRMPFARMITGLFIGELILVSIYVYAGKGMLALF